MSAFCKKICVDNKPGIDTLFSLENSKIDEKGVGTLCTFSIIIVYYKEGFSID